MKVIEQIIGTRTGKNGAFHPPSSVLCRLSSILCPLSSVLRLLSSVFCLLSSVFCLLSSVFCLLSSVLCPLSRAQEPVDMMETWAGGGLAGWINDSEATLSCITNGASVPSDAYLNMEFARQSMPACASVTTRKGIAGVVVTNLTFRFFATDRVPSAMRVCLHSGKSGNSWYVNLPAPSPGVWATYNVPVNYASHWIMGPQNSEEQFSDDILTMDWAGVYVRRHGDVAEQNYGIDDFRIQGQTLSADLDSNADGVPDVWDLEHGLNPYVPSDAALDSDQDGASNYAEYRAGTDPNDAGSLLELGMEPTPAESTVGIVLRWDSVANRIYSIWRATNLLEGFLKIGPDIPATPPVNEFQDTTATNAGPYFYRLQVNP